MTPTAPASSPATELSPVPLVDLRAQYMAQQAEIDAAVSACLASGWYVLGEQTAAFEAEFAAYIGSNIGASAGAGSDTVSDLGDDIGSDIDSDRRDDIGHARSDRAAIECVGVNSGTDALHLALRACGVGSGDEVITVAHTAVATAAAIVLSGAKPRFVDIDPQTYNLDPNALAQAISPRVKAIIPVHLYGLPADLAPILAQAQAAGIRVIEDCAQAHGARYRGRPVGTWGDLACFSFYPTKNLGALGDGGAVVGRDAHLIEQVRLLREYGWTPQARYVSQVHGMNSRLDEMQAAVLRVKLRALDEWNARRQELAARYAKILPSALSLPPTPQDATHVYHLYVIRTAQRDALRLRLQEAGIGTGIHYPVPIHKQPAYAHHSRDDGSQSPPATLPVTERIANEILSLPMHPFLTDEQVDRVGKVITQALHQTQDKGDASTQ